MFYKNEYDINIIGESFSDEDLKIFAINESLSTDFSNISNKWFVFSMKYGVDNGLNKLTAKSFGYMVTKFLTKYPVESTTNKYFNEKAIYLECFDFLAVYQHSKDSEIVRFKECFDYIFKIYSNEIEGFEYSNETIKLNVGFNSLERFCSIHGADYHEKFYNLLDFYFENNKI